LQTEYLQTHFLQVSSSPNEPVSMHTPKFKLVRVRMITFQHWVIKRNHRYARNVCPVILYSVL